MNPPSNRLATVVRTIRLRHLTVAACCAVFTIFAYPRSHALADGAKQLPPVGIEVPAVKRAALQKQLDALHAEIESIRTTAKSSPKAEEIQALLPDVIIYWNAVHTALADHEFFKPNEIGTGEDFARRRTCASERTQKGEAPWTHGMGSSCAAMFRGLTDRCSPTVSSSPSRTRRTETANFGSISGSTVGAKR